jgi:DNA processing protein
MHNPFPIYTLDLKSGPYKNIFGQIKSPPEIIYAQGRPEALDLLKSLPERGFAVVGTRAPQKRCLELTEKIILGLRSSNLIILSGLARGIDQKAHETALKADLPTVAILGCGIDQTYPPENESLKLKILEKGGLILSEWAQGINPLPPFFIQRNRLIAGLAHATWVVQAGDRSGACNTGNWASDMNKKVYCTPSFPGDPSLMGNQKLITTKQATPLWSLDDLTQSWFDLIHHLDGHLDGHIGECQSASQLLRAIEEKLNQGLSLPEVLVECSDLLNIPVERVIEEYEKIS